MTQQPPSPQVSVILPTYNEADNIVPLIHELKHQLVIPHEILVMDDNSPDGTAEAARTSFIDDPSVQVHIRQHDRGLANAIRDGIECSRGATLLVMDTDFNHDPAIAGQLVDRSAGVEMVIGSRFCPGGGMASRWRYYCSLIYSRWFVGPLLGTRVRDNLCGYYAIHRHRLMQLPLGEIFYGYGDYFFRLLWYLQNAGCSILEVPVCYRARPSGTSKSNLPLVLLQYTWEVLKFRAKTLGSHRRPVMNPETPG